MTLREDLDIAIRSSLFASSYRFRLEELRAVHQHAIEIVSSDVEVRTFNCFAFATGVYRLPRYQELVAAKQSSVLVNSGLIGALIDSGELQPIQDSMPGGLAIYFDGDRIVHAGRVLDDPTRLRS